MANDWSWSTYYEIKIDMESVGLNIGEKFGIDIQYNDDDDSGDRNRKYGWRGPDGADNAWMNPTWFGEIEFSN